MTRRFQDVTRAELAVLQSLWTNGRSNVRELTDELYPDGTGAHYATVKKLLERLESKGCVRRNRRKTVHTFEAAIKREELIGQRLRAVAESLCEGSFTPLLTHLVNSERLSTDELQSLRSLIAEFENENTQSRKRKR